MDNSDSDTITREEFNRRLYAPGVPSDNPPRTCPSCESQLIYKKSGKPFSNREYPEEWYCKSCFNHFDNPDVGDSGSADVGDVDE